MKRSAAASFALAAAGMIYSRLGGRRRQPEPEHEREGFAERHGGLAESHEGLGEQPAAGAEVDRARSELADELRRRASRPPADG